MKVCIVSGRYPNTTFDSVINHKLYANKYGYSYIHCNWPTKQQNPYFNKIKYIQSCIDFFDYLIWIDDDAFFYDFDVDIMQYKPTDHHILSICKSPDFKELKTFISSGQFILKCNSLAKEFLKEILIQDLTKIKDWWQPELGYFTNGDQDIFTYLLIKDDRFNKCATYYNYKKFNSRVENIFGTDSHNPLILHFTGKPNIKKSNYIKVQKIKKLNSSLVPDAFLKNYKIIDSNQKNTLSKNIMIYLMKFLKWLHV